MEQVKTELRSNKIRLAKAIEYPCEGTAQLVFPLRGKEYAECLMPAIPTLERLSHGFEASLGHTVSRIMRATV